MSVSMLVTKYDFIASPAENPPLRRRPRIIRRTRRYGAPALFIPQRDPGSREVQLSTAETNRYTKNICPLGRQRFTIFGNEHDRPPDRIIFVAKKMNYSVAAR